MTLFLYAVTALGWCLAIYAGLLVAKWRRRYDSEKYVSGLKTSDIKRLRKVNEDQQRRLGREATKVQKYLDAFSIVEANLKGSREELRFLAEEIGQLDQ